MWAPRRKEASLRDAPRGLFMTPRCAMILTAPRETDCLLRYEWPGPADAGELAPPRAGGRILVAWSAAGGGVPAAEHIDASDARAQALCTEGMDRGDDRGLSGLERWFFYMPLQHAEDRELQELSVRAFEELAASAQPEHASMVQGGLDYARRHRDVIERFGRFPHRNQVLGRDTTAEEREYLATHGGF
jgi:hypothetical protein